jgi:hypothetical protein
MTDVTKPPTILLETQGVRVGVGDLGDILDYGKAGVLPVDSRLLEQAAIIARQAVTENSEQAKDLIGGGDNKFPLKDLLKRLVTLNEAVDDTSNDELSDILHILDPGNGMALFPEADDAFFPDETIPELIEYYEARVVDLETSLEDAESDLRTEILQDVLRKGGTTDSGAYVMARNNATHLQAEKERYEHDIGRLKDYLEPVGDQTNTK